MSEDFNRRLTAILSADAVGYSRLMGDDEADTVRTLTGHVQAMTELVGRFRGRVVDNPGDNVLAEFGSVVEAVRCALEVQGVLEHRNVGLPTHRRMDFRIGVNLGDVIVEGDRLFGDGVNIAARLEGLAEPGGICVSATVFEHVRNKLDVRAEDLGEHHVKNISDPVRVFRIVPERRPEGPRESLVPSSAAPEAHGASRNATHRRARVAAGALLVAAAGYAGWLLFGAGGPDGPVEAGGVPGERPAIAVLAFDNISDDPTQEYFSDGISEDLITDLAKISALRVMARNTTFAYKGQASNVTQVGRELGVDYVVEGSVRKADGRIRVNAQLIDVRTGAHVWADRYDGPTQDVFAVQDAVVARIVQALRVTLTAAEERGLRVGGVDNLTAYDLVKRGWWYYHQFNRDDNERAREMFNRALEVVPEYAEALTGLGFTYYEEWAQLWTHDPTNLDLVRSLAQASLDLDPSDPATHTLLSHAFLWTNQHDLAVAELRAALALAPDDPWLLRDLAEALLFAGETSQAASYAERAIELVPRPVAPFPFTLGFVYHALGRYEESVHVLEQALELNPNYMPVPLVLAVSHLFLGNTDEARRYAAHAMDLNPGLSVDLLRERMPFRDSAVWARRAELLRQIGVP